VRELDEELARRRLREGVVDARLDGQPDVVEVERRRLARVARVDGRVLEHLAHVAVHELEQLRHDPALHLVDAHRLEDLRHYLGVVGQIPRFDHFVHDLPAPAVMMVRAAAVGVVGGGLSLGGCGSGGRRGRRRQGRGRGGGGVMVESRS
jgi:hypothetical protein